MSRAIEAAALFAVGVFAGSALVYTTKRTTPTSVPAQPPVPTPAAPVPSFRKDVIVGEAMSEGPIPPASKDIDGLEMRRLLRYGHPGPVFDVAPRVAFVSSYDRRMRNPAWVVEEITKEKLEKREGDRKDSVFVEDVSIPEKFRARLKDYFRSGYDRGHQVPAADAKFSQDAMNETFYLTNICPQVGDGFNRDYWAHFEDFCRRLTQKYASVRIFTGPLYLPRQYPDGKWRVTYEVIGSPPSVAVPTHFFKVIVAEGPDTAGPVAVGAFVLPNQEINNSVALTSFLTPVEAIERASGLEFLKDLPEGRRRELCRDVECSITVREFADRSQQVRRLSAPPSPAR